MDISVDTIYSLGKKVLNYVVSDDKEAKPQPKVAANQEQSLVKITADYLNSMKSWLYAPSGAVACSNDTTPQGTQEVEVGIPGEYPQPPEDAEGEAVGDATLVDDVLYLPEDGELEDQYFDEEIGSEEEFGFEHFSDTIGRIIVESNLLDIPMNGSLAIFLGTNSSKLPHIPADNADTADHYEGAFPGLVDSTLAADIDLPSYLACNSESYDYEYWNDLYTNYAHCPFASENRVPLYIRKIEVEGYSDIDGTIPVDVVDNDDNPVPAVVSTEILTEDEDLLAFDVTELGDPDVLADILTDPENKILPLGIISGKYNFEDGERPTFLAPTIIYNLIPTEWHQDDDVFIKAYVTLTMDRRFKNSEAAVYKSYLETWFKLED
jgi:hypothetical protein